MSNSFAQRLIFLSVSKAHTNEFYTFKQCTYKKLLSINTHSILLFNKLYIVIMSHIELMFLKLKHSFMMYLILIDPFVKSHITEFV